MQPSLHVFIALLTLVYSHKSLARAYNGFKHEAVEASHQQAEKGLESLMSNYTVTAQCPAPTPTRSILSILFPSPEASPVEITSQSQVVTSYIPEATWCVGPAIGLFPMTGPPYVNQSTIAYFPTTAGTGSCETMYAPTVTTVCATTLTGLASKITVSECDQEITFSSECGFTLETPTPVTTNYSLITPAPTVKRMMTYWLAPWQSLTAGETPTDVDIKICTVLDDDGNLECVHYEEVWEVFVVTSTLTTSRTVQLTTTVSGPGTLIVETMEAYITDTIETVDLTTTFLLETEIETESTSKSKKLVTRPEDRTSTSYITKYVKYRSTSTPEPTTTVRVTSLTTRYITRTETRHRPTLATF